MPSNRGRRAAEQLARARRRRRALIAVVLTAAAIAGGTAIARWQPWASGDEAAIDRDGSVQVSDEAQVEIERIPDTWHAVYHVQVASGDAVSETFEEVWIRRPFESRVETRRTREAADGTPPTSVEITQFGRRRVEAGLYRYVEMGKRYLPGEWPDGEPNVFNPANTATVYEKPPPPDQWPEYPPPKG